MFTLSLSLKISIVERYILKAEIFQHLIPSLDRA